MQTVLADLVRRRAKDPGLDAAMFSFVGVDVAPDLSHATVRVSILAPTGDGATDEAEAKAAVMAGLERSEPFLHREMGKELHMRRVPRLHFVLDESIEEADRMTTLMREVAHAEGRDF